MCRIGEVIQLHLLGIEIACDGNSVTFHLRELTKTFNFSNINRLGLQWLTICRLQTDPSICPIASLIDYMKLSLPYRKGEDGLFILPGKGSGPAKRQTVIKWIKDHFTAAGLGGYTVQSTRSSASTNALLFHMPVDDIVAKVGWLCDSTTNQVVLQRQHKNN